MGTAKANEIDAWLRQGGHVLTASERAARALTRAFHRRRQAEGDRAWSSPRISDWKSFVYNTWTDLATSDRMVLNAVQEQSLWASIAKTGGHMATQLEAPLYRLASLAMNAHELLCSHAPQSLRTSVRSGWQSDAAAFSQWLTEFDELCRLESLLSPARLPLHLLQLLQSPPLPGHTPRPPLLLAGFDRILPVQREVFDAWGVWREAVLPQPTAQAEYLECADSQAEIAASVAWCSRQLEANPAARLMIITQNAASQRGQIERAFLECRNPTLPFEFSLGVPLSQMPLVRAALLLLRWLSAPLAEHQIDWLFSSGYAAGNAEADALRAHMRVLRRRGLEQPDWTLKAFLLSIAAGHEADSLLKPWAARMTQAQRRLDDRVRRPQSPLQWAESVPALLESLGFAEAGRFEGAGSRSSADFQVVRRWQQALETAASLGFDGELIDWQSFLSTLARAVDETLFAAESSDAPILIAGPAESAGLSADAIWFLGATDDAWPAGGSVNPLLPLELQRQTGMPHATAQLDLELARTVTARLLASAASVTFSYAKQAKGVEARASRLLIGLGLAPKPLPKIYSPQIKARDLTELVADLSRIPFPAEQVEGGAAVLTAQSQCPFKGFATARLGAQSWEPAQPGLSPSQRGQLLHSVLHAVWAGAPLGIRTHAELLEKINQPRFIADHVARAFEAGLRPSMRERMPARYLELEQQRLVRLVGEWLAYEATRIPFEVLETESERIRPVAGLSLRLRLDRLDRLVDGSVLVIDYKTGDVTPKAWDPPRAEDVQLPLYARFALDEEQELGGLTFAKVRPGALVFAGCIGDPAGTLFADTRNISALAKNRLTLEQLLSWEASIEELARDFLAGHAEVDPRDYPKTCDRCGLQSICRIQEHRILQASDEEDSQDVLLTEASDD